MVEPETRRGPGRPRKPGDFPRHEARPSVSAKTPLLARIRVQPSVWRLDGRRMLPAVVNALAESADRFGTRFVFYRIEKDHLLLLLESPDRVSLERAMQGFGIRLSKALNRVMGSAGSVFAERYHLHVLETPDEVADALYRVLHEPRPHRSPPYVAELAPARSRVLRRALTTREGKRLARAIPRIEPRKPRRRPSSS